MFPYPRSGDPMASPDAIWASVIKANAPRDRLSEFIELVDQILLIEWKIVNLHVADPVEDQRFHSIKTAAILGINDLIYEILKVCQSDLLLGLRNQRGRIDEAAGAEILRRQQERSDDG